MAPVGLQGGVAGQRGGGRFGTPLLGVRGVGGLVHHRWLLVVMGVGVVAGLLGAGDPAALVVAPQGGGERGMSGSGAWGLVAVAAWFVGFLKEG